MNREPANSIQYWAGDLADEVAPKVRAMHPRAWVRLKWYLTPDGPAAFEPEIVPIGAKSGDMRNVFMAGRWISQYDAYQAEKQEEAEEDAELDGEPADPDLPPHSNIYTEDYR